MRVEIMKERYDDKFTVTKDNRVIAVIIAEYGLLTVGQIKEYLSMVKGLTDVQITAETGILVKSLKGE